MNATIGIELARSLGLSRGRRTSGMTVSTPPDKAAGATMSACIVRIADHGDRDAFGQIFNYFAPRVKSYMMRLGAEPNIAEDLAQDTMLTVWRRAQSFDPGKAAASTWIFTIARNLRIDLARRDSKPSPKPDPSDMPEAPMAPDDAIDALEDQSRLKTALSRLPPDQAEVIRAAYFSDKPHAQVAIDLGIPLGTVKSRIRLAFARLREALSTEVD